MTTTTEHSDGIRRAAIAPQQFPPLESVTRPNLTTQELCHYANIRPQTAWVWACKESGPVRPIRIGRRLGWPTKDVQRLCGVAA